MTAQTVDPTARRVPPFGGLNRTLIGIELRRMVRNRRTSKPSSRTADPLVAAALKNSFRSRPTIIRTIRS